MATWIPLPVRKRSNSTRSGHSEPTRITTPSGKIPVGFAGNGASTQGGSFPYSHVTSLYDVLSGSNGSCSGGYLCTAGAGYDGPTGLGTPNGTGGF